MSEGMSFVTDRSIDACVKRVRAKLKEVNPDPDPIQTVYGIGYKLNQELVLIEQQNNSKAE